MIDENIFFRQATLRICGNLDFEFALQDCLIYLKSFIPVDIIQLNLYDQGLTALRTFAIATPTNTKRVNDILPLDSKGRKFLDNPNLPSAMVINQPLKNPVSGPIIQKSGYLNDRSSMVMHLIIKGKKLGNLILLAKGKNIYSKKHLRLFSILNEPFAIALSNALKYEEINHLKETMADDLHILQQKSRGFSFNEFIGEDFGLKESMQLIRKVAPLESPVMLLGETGVGKEIFANIIHTLSRRNNMPFIRVNCGAIPETLIDSELFGHEKGAFTGAIAQKRGYFEQADGGTIFLDEVAELPPQVQVRMLRVIQEKEIVRVGGSDQIKVNIRIITATHQNLQKRIKKGLFRSDLWFRLHVFPITIPPLRERKEDIPGLVHHFILKKTKEMQISNPPTIATHAMDSLKTYSWPGNVRELENVVERALILNRGSTLAFDDIVWPDNGSRNGELPKEQKSTLKLDKIISAAILRVLEMTKGKINGPSGAAEILGINPGTLRHRMRKLGIPFGRVSKT